MSTFDERDFAALDPEVLRVRITLLEGFALNVQESWLGVEIKSAAGEYEAAFELAEESAELASIPAGFFLQAERGTAYVLKLSGSSTAKFTELQQFVTKGRSGEVTIRVAPALSSFPADVDETRVWIDLLLSDAQGYFTLLNAAKVPLEKIREHGTGS